MNRHDRLNLCRTSKVVLDSEEELFGIEIIAAQTVLDEIQEITPSITVVPGQHPSHRVISLDKTAMRSLKSWAAVRTEYDVAEAVYESIYWVFNLFEE